MQRRTGVRLLSDWLQGSAVSLQRHASQQANPVAALAEVHCGHQELESYDSRTPLIRQQHERRSQDSGGMHAQEGGQLGSFPE